MEFMVPTLYHGTNLKVRKLRPSPVGLFGAGVYLSDDFEDAAQYGRHVAVVRARLLRPMLVEADYEVAAVYDCDSPAGSMVLDVLGPDRGAKLLRALARRPFGLLGRSITRRLQAIGHDGLLIRWPGGMQHALVFSPEQAQIECWLE